MRTLGLALCVVLVVGCSKKQPDAAVDRYINQELAPHLAKVLAARAGYDDIKAEYVESLDNLPNLTHRLTDAGLPLLTQALDGLGKLAPPPGVKPLTDDLIAIVTEEQGAVADMSKALDPLNVAAFKAGHERIMAVQERIVGWEHQLEAVLAEHAVKLQPLPDVDIPKPRPRTPAPPVFDAPCDPATKVEVGGVVTACTLTDGYRLCGPGKATFHPNAAPHTCVTEMMFAPPEAEAGTPKDQVVVCGAGPLAYSPDGVVEACTLAADVMVGATRLPKGSAVTLGAKAKVAAATLPDGSTFTAP